MALNLDLECTEEDFGEISRKVAGYHQYKNLLGLTQAEIEDIEHDPKNFYSGIQGRFYKILLKWKSKLNAQQPPQYATFGKLVKIARRINDGLAVREFERICAERSAVKPTDHKETVDGQGVGNVEYQTMLQCTEILVNELSASVEAFGDIFQGKGFLAPETHEALTSDRHDKKHKSRVLVNRLQTKVHTNHQNFYTIVSALKEQGEWTNDVVAKLKEVYEGFGGKQFPGANVIPGAAPIASASSAATVPPVASPVEQNGDGGEESDDEEQETMFCDRSTRKTTPRKKPLPRNVAAGAALQTKLWDERELVVRFLNPEILSDPKDPWKCGNSVLSPELVLAWASKWNREGIPNIVLEDAGRKVAHIRVKFIAADDQRSWSKVGNDARDVTDEKKPTMVLNLKTLKRREHQESMVLHEFGHALGLEHEHQRSDFWDILEKFTIGKDLMKSGDSKKCKEACEEVFKDPSNSSATKDFNMSSEYDPDSIMHYWFDINWLKPEYRDLEVPSQEYLSLTEKEKEVIRGVHKRHYTRGLPKKPSEGDYKFLQEQYKQITLQKDPVRTELPTTKSEPAPPDPTTQPDHKKSHNNLNDPQHIAVKELPNLDPVDKKSSDFEPQPVAKESPSSEQPIAKETPSLESPDTSMSILMHYPFDKEWDKPEYKDLPREDNSPTGDDRAVRSESRKQRAPVPEPVTRPKRKKNHQWTCNGWVVCVASILVVFLAYFTYIIQ